MTPEERREIARRALRQGRNAALAFKLMVDLMRMQVGVTLMYGKYIQLVIDWDGLCGTWERDDDTL